MTPKQLQSRLDGQSSIAKKVYQFIPIADSWTHQQIASEMVRVTGAHTDHRIMQGCINTLKDSGLVKEPQRGKFQRTEIKTKEEAPKKEDLVIQKPTAKAPQKKQSAIEILSEISEDMRNVAKKLDDAALRIAEQDESNAENLKKLEALQGILRSMV